MPVFVRRIVIAGAAVVTKGAAEEKEDQLAVPEPA
jgi:hypothetical protein